VWESNASGGYAISEDTEGEQLGRGTQIKLFLKVSFQQQAIMLTLRLQPLVLE
jgi:HSP90 family molecular chaperone